MHVWDVGLGDVRPAKWGRVYEGTWGRRDARSGMWRNKRELRNKRNHFLLQMNIKYNFQRIKGRSLLEGPSEHRQTTFCFCGVFMVGLEITFPASM